MTKVKAICKLSRKNYPLLKDYEQDWPVIDMLKLHLKYTSEAHRRAKALESVKQIKQVSLETECIKLSLTRIKGTNSFNFKTISVEVK